MEPIVFKIFTKVSLNNIIWKLKAVRESFLNSVFKQPKMRNVIQIFLNKIPY